MCSHTPKAKGALYMLLGDNIKMTQFLEAGSYYVIYFND